MNSIIQHDVQRLRNDLGAVRHVLEMLENDRSSWKRRREEKDISDFITCLSQIEVDMSTSIYDFISNRKDGREHEGFIIESMQRAFARANDLFYDIKIIRKDLNNSFITMDELENLKIDWARFSKNIIQVLSSVQKETYEAVSPNSGFLV